MTDRIIYQTSSSMTLRRAKEIAAAVGASIRKVDDQSYEVTLGVKAVGEDGSASFPRFFGSTPQIAATVAIIETGRAAMQLASKAKGVYADSEVLF